jgi:hypothetical protein
VCQHGWGLCYDTEPCHVTLVTFLDGMSHPSLKHGEKCVYWTPKQLQQCTNLRTYVCCRYAKLRSLCCCSVGTVHWDTLQQQRLSNLARAPLHMPAGSGLLIGSTSLFRHLIIIMTHHDTTSRSMDSNGHRHKPGAFKHCFVPGSKFNLTCCCCCCCCCICRLLMCLR